MVEQYRSRGQRVALASIWDIQKGSQKLFSENIQAQDYLASIGASSRVLFLLHCIQEALHRALQAQPDLLLFDAYWYKYMASEIVHGVSATEILALVQGLPVPDRIIHLEIPVEEATRRKGVFTAYEAGLKQPSRESFEEFQTQMRPVLRELIQRQSRSVSWLDGMHAPATVLSNVLEVLDGSTNLHLGH